MLDRYKLKPVSLLNPKKVDILEEPKACPLRKITHFPLIDDFYSNILTYSGRNLFFCVNSIVFYHNWYQNRTRRYTMFPYETINAISAHGPLLVAGAIEGYLNIFDMNTTKNLIYKMHKSRIGCLDHYRDLVFTGSRDRFVKVVDLRVKKEVMSLCAHTQEICGLKINKDCTLLASGGNDNKLIIYDMRKFDAPIKFNDHVAAVKALSWSKTNDKLISGGGTACKTIKMWDMKKYRLLKTIDTGSQVCGLYWGSKNEIISAHGYSQNEVKVWDHDFNTRRVLRMHKNRVLHFAVSKEEDIFCTGSSENEICFWSYSDDINELHR